MALFNIMYVLQVAKQAEVNQMTASNLAVCLAPTLLRLHHVPPTTGSTKEGNSNRYVRTPKNMDIPNISDHLWRKISYNKIYSRVWLTFQNCDWECSWPTADQWKPCGSCVLIASNRTARTAVLGPGWHASSMQVQLLRRKCPGKNFINSINSSLTIFAGC